MAELRKEVLDSKWVDATRNEMLSLRQGEKSFAEYSTSLRTKNNLLAGTSSFLKDDALKNQLEAGMNEELREMYNEERIRDTAGFRDWLKKCKDLDERRTRLERRVDKRIQRQAPRPRQPLAPTNRQPTVGSSAPYEPRKNTLPPLTDDERRVLRDNNGCFKC